MNTPTELRAICGHDSRSVDGCVHCQAADLLEQRAAEIERLKTQNNTVARVALEAEVERDTLQAEVEQLKRDCDIANLGFDMNSKTIVALAAKLSAMEKQEPGAWMLTTKNYGLDAETWDTVEYRDCKWDADCEPLFTAPKVAQPLSEPKAYYEEQPDGTVIPVDPSEMRPLIWDERKAAEHEYSIAAHNIGGQRP